jgi:hypothetical protein
MKNTFRTLTAILFSLCAAQSARADWANYGVGYSCNEYRGVFSIVSVIETSDPGFDEHPQSAEIKLESGKQTVQCDLKKLSIEAKVEVWPPDLHQGGGAGWVYLRLFSVNGKVLFHDESFGSFRDDPDGTLIRIDVKKDGPELTEITTCYANSWDWFPGYTGVRCTTETLKAPPDLKRDTLKQNP